MSQTGHLPERMRPSTKICVELLSLRTVEWKLLIQIQTEQDYLLKSRSAGLSELKIYFYLRLSK